MKIHVGTNLTWTKTMNIARLKYFFRLVKFLDKYLIKRKPLYQNFFFVKMSNVLYLVWKAGIFFYIHFKQKTSFMTTIDTFKFSGRFIYPYD